MGETGTGTPDGSFATWGVDRSHSRCSVAISGNPLTSREMLSSQVPCFDKLRWCIRILKVKIQQETETKTETLFKMFFCGFGPPSLVEQLKGSTPSFVPCVLYNSAAFLYLVCVSALSICLQIGKTMFGAPVVSSSASACNAEETYSFT